MVVIKRYPNRKLYDSEAKKYITLDGIAELIRDGKEVQIMDHTTGEDLTAVTLTQIIFEREKKQGGFLPRSVLTGLVQAGGDTLGTLRKTLASPLEMLRHVDEEIEKRVYGLVRRGEIEEDEGATLLQKLLGRATNRDQPPYTESEIKYALEKHNVPTQDDLNALSKKIDALASALEEIESK